MKDFRQGHKVLFTLKYLQPEIGTIKRINQRTATLDCESDAGLCVPFGMLCQQYLNGEQTHVKYSGYGPFRATLPIGS